MTTLPASARPIPESAGARQAATIALVLILTCQLMVILDATIVTIALPNIRASLHFSSTSLSWVQNIYSLTFGGLLLLGARAGDILGRRRVFIAGITLFTFASFLGGVATSGTWLLIARAVQGVGAAIAAPSTLALLTSSFPEGRQRLRAIGLYSAVSSGGASVGLVLGGMLTDWISWRWSLFINVPIGIVLVLLAPRYLPETERSPGHFDLAGAITSTLGMSSIVYGFVRAAANGWSDPITVSSFVVGAALLATFVRVELRAEQPITPLRLFTSRNRNASYVARLLLVGGMFGMFFFLTQYLQGVRDYSALKAGFAFLPMTVALFAMVRIVPRVSDRIGARRLMIAGEGVATLSMIWLSRLSATSQYFPDIVVPMFFLGLGMGVAFIPLTTTSLAGVEPRDAGAASGLVNVTQQVGGALGLGILVTVFGTASKHAAQHPLVGATALQERHHELAHAIATAFTGSAVFLALTFSVIVFAIRQRPAVLEADSIVAAGSTAESELLVEA
jgi:EmrB/QacA subfamily drug resistance transporter